MSVNITDDQIDEAIEVIRELKSDTYLLACKYYCYDYRIMLFYNSDEFIILDQYLGKRDEARDILVDFIDYYQVETSDIDLIEGHLTKLNNILQ